MERFEPEISFDLPSHLNFDTFSTFPLTGSNNRSVPAEAAVTENFLRQLSEKIGRGISGSQLGLIRNQVILNGSVDPSEDWIRQAEYDKFMNEIWIGIVLTLIVISMVFCICSCFLYHQFRQWKNNYHRNLQQSNDIESVKLSIEDDDLPNYTLVSGLPSYDAALEQLQKSSTSNTCLLMYPSVFKIFTTNEKQDVLESLNNDEQSTEEHQHQRIVLNIAPSYQEAMGIATDAGETKTEEAPSYQEALLAINHS